MFGQSPPPTVVVENITVEGSSTGPWVTWVPIVVAGLALGFTVLAFWWQNGRRGHLVANVPRTCAVGPARHVFLLRFPLTLCNTGVVPLVVTDVRCKVLTATGTLTLPWRSTRTTVRPENDDFEDYPRSFTVGGRDAHSMVIEFGVSKPTFSLDPGPYRVLIEATEGMGEPSDDTPWMHLTSFKWHLHQHSVEGGSYVACSVGPMQADG